MGKKNRNNFKDSSGDKRVAKYNRIVRVLTTKIARWNRYKEEILCGQRKTPTSRWDTTKLEKEVEKVKTLNKKGPKQRK